MTDLLLVILIVEIYLFANQIRHQHQELTELMNRIGTLLGELFDK